MFIHDNPHFSNGNIRSENTLPLGLTKIKIEVIKNPPQRGKTVEETTLKNRILVRKI